MSLSRGSQRGRLLLFFNKGHRLARALFEQNSIRFDFSSIHFDSISARARIVVGICVRFQLELELWLEFVSKFELIGIRNRKIRNRKIARKWLLEMASIAKVSKTIRKNGKG